MNGIQYGYDELINSVFEAAYDDLVTDYMRARKCHQDAKYERGAKQKDLEKDAKNFAMHALWLEEWFDEVLPCWRDIDPARIIKRAREEADGVRPRRANLIRARHEREV